MSKWWCFMGISGQNFKKCLLLWCHQVVFQEKLEFNNILSIR